MSGPTAVRLENVFRSYLRRGCEVPALTGLSASVAPGRLAALVGPNGSGKTTALRIVATLVRPSSGRVFVFERDAVTDSSAVRRSVGVSLGGGRSFYWRLTVRHNLSFFARLRGVRPRCIAYEVRRLAAEFDVERFLAAPVRGLSRGTLARLAVARACLGEPPLLVLDEPFASVDERARDLVWNALARRVRSGKAVLLATHEREVAARCDLVVELAGGRRSV